MNKNLGYKVGYVMLVKTFAGPTIHTRVKNIIDYKTKIGGEEVHVKGFEGVFTRRKDILALKKASVPFTGNEKPSSCVTFTYDNQIVKVIRKK